MATPKSEEEKALKVPLSADYHSRLRHLAIDQRTAASRLAQRVIEQFLDDLDKRTSDAGTSDVKNA